MPNDFLIWLHSKVEEVIFAVYRRGLKRMLKIINHDNFHIHYGVEKNDSL